MNKLLPIMITSGLIVGMITIPTEAAAPKAKTYKNCTELNKAYKGGVAKASNVKNKGGKTKYKPYVSKALYEANQKSDRDKDLIACER
ncbi:excalibur calcium-binding domain-containing protein [Fictibacillus phosphorivorans]|nr:excalibur calcium-binding domain-containing protein [Fictibacillus phosphorivorans]MQR94652.1 excalibur calcium-binding domain-containing protein [Fictibacillus phosphorivorans]